MARASENRQRPWWTGALLTVAAFSGLAMGFAGCNSGGDCVSTEEYFQTEVWSSFMSETCFSCHNSQGQASHTEFILRSSDWPGYIETNLAVLENLARIEVDGVPLLLAKPTMQGIEHGGGMQIESGSDQYKALESLIGQLEEPVRCDSSVAEAEFFNGVSLLNEEETLRKASLALAGRLPTPEEVERVRDLGIESLEPVLDEMMQEEEFHERLVELWNDILLTDRYLPNSDAIDLLDATAYPNAYWFNDLPDGVSDEQRFYANVGVARENLHLIQYLVANDLPFTGVVTADYVVLNPGAAKTYGVFDDISWTDANDPWELQPATLKSAAGVPLPHAGVMSSAMFLNRFPTTETNRNRHRARMTLLFFLATDILRVGERPVDADSISNLPNPTMNANDCKGCHSVIDPIAGTYQNWSAGGTYSPPEEGWYGDMRLPGFEGADLPEGDYPTSIQWLGQQIAADDRFAVSVVQIMYRGITGREALVEPNDPSMDDYGADLAAFKVQQQVLAEIASKFRDNSYNLKTVIKELVKSPYFRARNTSETSEDRLMELADVGTAKFLTPEQLHRKIEAVTGYPWRNGVNGVDYLLSGNEYRIFYGGIDSNSITERIDEPNGLMANIAARMSNEMGCWATARDFSKAPADRLLFPYVEPSFVPEEENGFAVPAVTDALKANIQYLYLHILGEQVELNSPEVNRAYELFVAIWEDGKAGLADETYGVQMPNPCRAQNDWWTGEPLPEERQIVNDPDYTIRAWMGVVTYLLADYRFLHE